jgi:hypothetical protein
LAIVFLVAILFGCTTNPNGQQFQNQETSRTLFTGIHYHRVVRSEPRPMVIHVVTVDLMTDGIGMLVTPGDQNLENSLPARTTSSFLSDFDLQLAINGDAFQPWYQIGPFYFPRSGDMVEPVGFAASKGVIYSQDTNDEPTLYIYKNKTASINVFINRLDHAISGNLLLVQEGNVIENLGGKPEPRTAVGLNRIGQRLTIIVVDGRQPGYSEGVTLDELASIMKENQVHAAINLDGGGSSTLVIEGENGTPEVLNSPVHQGIPGVQRPVGNHLGFYAANN